MLGKISNDKSQIIKHAVFISINVLCLIAFFLCLLLSASIRNPLRSQQVAEAWAGQSGERFAQISVFISESEAFDRNQIFMFRESLDAALLVASLESGRGRVLYADAWSAKGSVSIASELIATFERNPVTAPVTGVGGDFFLFHPFTLRDGSYISPNDFMKDRVVLDEELAWRLFGSVNLAGLEVLVNNKPFTIAGVVARESDFASQRAYSGGAGLFMSFEALEALMDLSGGEVIITCYEIVMPDPITGFALRLVTESEAFADSDVHIVENSARFSLLSTFDTIRSFGERSMRGDAIAFPYWENAARLAEDWLAVLLVLALIFIIFPVVCGVIYSIKIIRFLIKRGKKSVRKAIDNRDQRLYEKYLLEHSEEPQIYNVDDIIREVNGDLY